MLQDRSQLSENPISLRAVRPPSWRHGHQIVGRQPVQDPRDGAARDAIVSGKLGHGRQLLAVVPFARCEATAQVSLYRNARPLRSPWHASMIATRGPAVPSVYRVPLDQCV